MDNVETRSKWSQMASDKPLLELKVGQHWCYIHDRMHPQGRELKVTRTIILEDLAKAMLASVGYENISNKDYVCVDDGGDRETAHVFVYKHDSNWYLYIVS